MTPPLPPGPFLRLLLLTLGALGLVNRGLREQGGPFGSPLIWSLYGATSILLLLQAALLAFFTYRHRQLERGVPQPERWAFWWIPPPAQQIAQRLPDASVPPWRPGSLDDLYLSCTVSFSSFPHVDPIRPAARLLVIAQLVALFDVDLMLPAGAVGLIPS